jgi:hypothetical protein
MSTLPQTFNWDNVPSRLAKGKNDPKSFSVRQNTPINSKKKERKNK